MTPIVCPRILTKCGRTYHNYCGSLFAFDNTNRKCNFSTGNILRKKSHYDVLGLTPKATQVDVKAAYYNLSKVYHPDRNEGSADAAEKFRDISDAYEILGNYKLRRLYDKGIIHTAGAQYKDVEETVEEVKDDAQTRFYKRHMKRTEAPTATGRTPIFNFDEWNNEHYGKAFERSQAARKKFYGKPAENLRQENSGKYEITIFGGMVLMILVLYGSTLFEKKPDEVSESTKR
ncbi:dnaJ homolog subfamily C member 30, mitochondrial isoform X2 [Bradysia coprophila]|nr:dnaJ homolog subfamily C member 30, mitochondrial isoform X2 [Bradysia coprophila]